MSITGHPSPRPAPDPTPVPPESRPAEPSGALARLLRGAVDLALPAACLGCGRAGEGSGPWGLCLACRGRRRPAPAGCAACGEPLPAAALGPLPDGWACGACRREPPPFAALLAPWVYEGPVAAAVRALKFGRLDYLGGHFADELAPAVAEALHGLEAPEDGGESADAVVVPVPLHWRRRWSRGYNQAERIARPLATRLGLPCVPALRRRRATPPQTRLDRERRLAGPRDAFAARRSVRPSRRVEGAEARRAVLVDDVVTTGATLRAAARELRRAGFVEVLAVAVARTPVEPSGRPTSGRRVVS